MIFTQIIGMSSGTSFCFLFTIFPIHYTPNYGNLVRATNNHVCMYHINSFWIETAVYRNMLIDRT
jgi:hypothetical protein